MAFDATFWVAVSFLIFFGALVYFKIPQKINELCKKGLYFSSLFTKRNRSKRKCFFEQTIKSLAASS